MKSFSDYIDVVSGEKVPAHQIGTTEDGMGLYQAVEGYEPNGPYECDEDGNWIPTEPNSQPSAGESENYHLTELDSGAWTTGLTDALPGEYLASSDRAWSYVAPGTYVREYERRNGSNAIPGTDEATKLAIEAHRAGKPLPAEPPTDAQPWGPRHTDYPALEPISGAVRRQPRRGQ